VKWKNWIASALGLILSQAAFASEPLDTTLKPEDAHDPPQIFKDMGVVQKRAMSKRLRFLTSLYGTFDFSDGPFYTYSLNINPGFAISDFFEIYIHFSPLFIQQPKSIVSYIESLRLENGQQATLVTAQPWLQYGIELLWSPLYGKDSLGMKHIIRSDTFFKLGGMNTHYRGSAGTGLRFNLGIGKTFFLTRWFGIRATATGNAWQTILDSVKQFRFFFNVEAGVMFYIP
jgi:outer membrane beta-barrel protein